MSESHIRTTCLATALLSLVSANAMALTGTATRPQLTTSEASTYTITKALAKAGPITALVTDNWNPTAGVALLSADYAVAADGSTPYRTVQAAIDAAVAAGGTTRRYISIKAGIYTGLVCVPTNAPPLTVFGLGTDSTDTVIRFNNANPTPKPTGIASHPCASNAAATTVGTSNSATLTVRAAGFQARHLRVDNDYVEGTYTDNNQSAVALAVRGDKASFEDVVITGNQDTLLISATNAANVIRSYFKNSTIEGDVDFIFGSGVGVFDNALIRSAGARLGSSRGGYIFAPSTRPGSPYGFLAINSRFVADSGSPDNQTYLGRAWDEGVRGLSAYVNGTSPNGQVTVRDSNLGSHIRKTAPWDASTASRPYCSSNCTNSANRFYEYGNSGAGAGN
ncbi:acyl-CoA thioesterase [Xanthomonas oryzae]|uniref:putative acyl-CoA thioester hydrolase n=1 Tax=Xanthomonas oryzae TaxID=347 RepID=UPI00040D1305|nr:putative acyl-CoA thioester hydrolase [Xanthomonas oryzae]ALS94644.1 acyl-CoA thioesterase [Xanthomonas oryzae pv. oryzae]AUI90803.1 acyl-CoA thioesterase [Xanthomonas oryzae pv. oryzae]AUI94477.1 acyl-CoA thioesterase [Xanthomonas oryzae pv. oryzae]AUI98147.1 acyl-CoA thioesterase [Xanthomonas oryzae pv. oryzae]AUJ01822.1 acyl-CoA thioesterase [Xanthomonas oryzae pv. oryzae]